MRQGQDQARQEVCVCAAIKLDDGYIVRGHRHDDCIHTITKLRKAGRNVGQARQEAQGFMTTKNRWVSREEGAALMRESGLVSAHTGKPFNSRLLFSEDLY